MKNEDRFVGRKVKFSHYDDVREVIFMDRSVGITLAGENEWQKTCINGPLSPKGKDRYYDEMFDAMEKMIDNFYIDLDVLDRIWHNDSTLNFNDSGGKVTCAVGG